MGCLAAPMSAGRIHAMGLRMFVDGMDENWRTDRTDAEKIDATLATTTPMSAYLDRVGRLVRRTQGASLVLRQMQEAPIKHIVRFHLSHDRALVVLVFRTVNVKTAFVHPPPGQTASSMREAREFLTRCVEGKTISELARTIAARSASAPADRTFWRGKLVEAGLACGRVGARHPSD